MASATIAKFCGHCGGNAGFLNSDGVHNLCAARRSHNLPTPSLGMVCPECKGSGVDPKRGMKAGQSVFDPSGAALKRLFTNCPTCRGTRAVGRIE